MCVIVLACMYVYTLGLFTHAHIHLGPSIQLRSLIDHRGLTCLGLLFAHSTMCSKEACCPGGDNTCECTAPGPKGCGGELNGLFCYPVQIDGKWRCRSWKGKKHSALVGTAFKMGCGPCDTMFRPENHAQNVSWAKAAVDYAALHPAGPGQPSVDVEPAAATTEEIHRNRAAASQPQTPAIEVATASGEPPVFINMEAGEATGRPLGCDQGAEAVGDQQGGSREHWWSAKAEFPEKSDKREFELFAAESMDRIVKLTNAARIDRLRADDDRCRIWELEQSLKRMEAKEAAAEMLARNVGRDAQMLAEMLEARDAWEAAAAAAAAAAEKTDDELF